MTDEKVTFWTVLFIRSSLVDYLDLLGLRTSTVDICIALIVQYITLAN